MKHKSHVVVGYETKENGFHPSSYHHTHHKYNATLAQSLLQNNRLYQDVELRQSVLTNLHVPFVQLNMKLYPSSHLPLNLQLLVPNQRLVWFATFNHKTRLIHC